MTSEADTIQATGSIHFVGVGCELEAVDRWQHDLATAPSTLSLTDDTLTVRTTIGDDDVVIEFAETTFSEYS